MTREEITAWIAAREEAFNRHDAAVLTGLFAADGVVDSPTAGRTVAGLRAINEVHRAWTTGFPDATFHTRELLIDGNRIAWVVMAAGTDTGGFMGLPPTGRPFELPMVVFTTFRGSLIASERRIYDFTGMLVQIGIFKVRAAGGIPSGVHTDPPASARVDRVDAPAPARAEIAAILANRERSWARRDVRALADQHAADCVMDSHLAGRVEGTSAIADVYAAWFTAFPDSEIVSEETIVDGSRVARLATMTGTDAGGFLGRPPTGKPFRLRSAWLYTLRGGRFVHVRPIYDFTGMLVQLGVVKAKPE